MPVIQENKNISVREAICKGRQMLLLPRILLALGLFFFMFMGGVFFIIMDIATPRMVNFAYKFGLFWLITFIPFVILPYWFWSKRTTCWKLWAFENVNNVHELSRVAHRAALFANYGSFWDKITLQTKSEREQWANLQIKFERADVFEDDVDVPTKTVIYFTTTGRLLLILFYLGIGALGLQFTIGAFYPGSHKWVALISISLMAWMLYLIFIMIKDIVDHRPQIILDNKGVETVKGGFNSWNAISNIRVTPGSKHDVGSILRYQHPNGMVKLDIAYYSISHDMLDHLLRIYRGRYNSNQSSTR
jgi:hypothetical protein